MVSAISGLITSSTISDDRRVATFGFPADAVAFSARMVAPSFLGASPDNWRLNSVCLAGDRAANRLSHAARAAAPRAPIPSHAALISAGITNGPCDQP